MRTLMSLLESTEVSGYEGLNFGNTSRSPQNVDEAGSTIKHTLGKIENRRQAVLAATVDRHQKQEIPLPPGLPDIYDPVRRLTDYLLPHLRFERIDFSNEDNIQCYWERKDSQGTSLVDIDDLSSGEKSIIVLFLPLLEDQIQSRLNQLVNFGQDVDVVIPRAEDRLILIDEPEQHLHPDLQAKILGYIRTVSRESPTQFIITTHSPTMLDQAFEDELFVLVAPTENPNENQLHKVATNTERLEALKQLAGSTYFLTTGRIIVCIEGEKDADPEKPTDARLLEILYPRAAAVTLVPTTGKGNVITTVARLGENVPEETFRIRVRGLVDADQSTTPVPGIETLPVCMIENLLLDSESIIDYLWSEGINTFENSDAIQTELKAIAAEQRGHEIALRLRRKLKPKTVRVSGSTVEEIRANHVHEMEQLNAMLPADDALNALVEEITNKVDQIITANSELKEFRGKEILRSFYGKHIAKHNIGYNIACIEIAKNVAEKGGVAEKLDPVFDRLLAN